MAKKYIDVMDTSFRDGFQSVFGGRVLKEDFYPAVEAAVEAGLYHFEFGGGARFQAPIFYLQENPFDMMDGFREIVGPKADLQVLARGRDARHWQSGDDRSFCQTFCQTQCQYRAQLRCTQ